MVVLPGPRGRSAGGGGTEESSWRRSVRLAEATPSTRNRYVDFLRAASLSVVVLGHWLMAAPTVERQGFTLSDMLHVSPWTQWLTWVFQVMPVFFLVGGYANAASWASAGRAGRGYADWLSRRLQRLVRPVVPFVLVWAGLAFAGRWLGVSERLVRTGSAVAFVPTWFLAVYVLVVVLAPAMHVLWRRWGWASVGGLALAAAAVDGARAYTGVDAAGSLNYAFVWLALHQLGFAWRDGALSGARRTLPLAAAGAGALALLVGAASYPVSMVTVPGERAANANPPTLALLALGVTHAGLLLSLEGRARRRLERPTLWAATVLVNGSVMTVYLWHATVMVVLVALAGWPGGMGLGLEPGTTLWWATRPTWVLVLLVALGLFVAAFGRVESRPPPHPERPPAAWRSVAGAVAVCVGLVALGVGGVGAETPLGFRLWAVLVALVGALLVAAVRLPWARAG